MPKLENLIDAFLVTIIALTGVIGLGGIVVATLNLTKYL
jgi:hypothetical protein